jgi:hypothetical protein
VNGWAATGLPPSLSLLVARGPETGHPIETFSSWRSASVKMLEIELSQGYAVRTA